MKNPKVTTSKEIKLKRTDIAELTRTGGRDFSITSALLHCDNKLVKALIEKGAKIEYSKRIRPEFRGLSDAPRRDLIFMSIPHSIKKPTVPGLKFGYVLYVHVSANDITRIRTIINFSAVDTETNRFMLFGPDFEFGVKMNKNWDVDKKDLSAALELTDVFFEKLDRFITAMESDAPKKEPIKILNRELIGAMLRTARRTTEVVNIDLFNKEEALTITPRLSRCAWAKKKTKLQLWRIAFNNVFDIDLVNDLGIKYHLHGGVSTMTRKYKGDEAISSIHEIPILELISRSLLASQVTSDNFENLMIPVKFDIRNFV